MGLRSALIRLGRLEQARTSWRLAIEANSRSIGVRDGYAEFCLYLGHFDDYRQERSLLLELSAGLEDPQAAERIGRACLLLPATKEQTERAAALIDQAMADRHTPAPAWTRPYFLLAKGLAEYRFDRFSSAIASVQGDAANVLRPCPGLITAMAQHRLGLTAEARESLTAALASPDADAARLYTREGWIREILRREAEGLIRGGGP